MHDLLEQIEKALECNLYYLALQSTLALPDICGALESENMASDLEHEKNSRRKS